jgi:hypothetical protein
MGEGTKLPDGFPADVPLPSGKIFTAMSSDGTFAVLFKVDDAKKAFADYLEALESAGFDVSDKTEGEMNNDFFGAFTATGKGWRAVVSATGSGDQVLGVNVEPAS